MSGGGGHNKILAGLGIGAVAGVAANTLVGDSPQARATLDTLIDTVAHPIGQIFLRLLFVVVLPLVFASIAVGVSSLGDLKKLGSLGARTLAFFVLTSVISAVLGITALHLLQPGAGFDPQTLAEMQAKYAGDVQSLASKASAGAPTDLLGRVNQILDMFLPRNLLKAAVEMQMIPVIVFALVFGAALTLIDARKRESMNTVLESLSDAMVTIVGFAMKLAPLAVGCLIFGVTARFGFGLLQKLGAYVAIILVCYVIQLVVLYPVLLTVLARRNPWQFLKSAMPVMVTALSTSSSNATLPTSIRVAQESLGIRPQIAGFVLPLGATMNMNGTALFEGAVVLFVAQVFGIELALQTQAMIVGMCVLTAIGAAGVPGGSLPLLMGVMAQAGVPPDGIAIVLGVDRVLDMGRTVINVMGDQVCAAYIEAVDRPRA
ncbi:MAG: dicarboxylate/amino acid:cation symporter [Planctomycetota bacterium]|nr:dicarboxylate/amino acid:cation symporter [Planctomycetota bacterium]